MQTRIVSGLIGIVVLIGILMSGQIGFTSAVFLLAAVGIYEFYSAMNKGGYKPIKWIGYLSTLFILVVGFNNIFFSINNTEMYTYLQIALFVVFVILSCYIVFKHEKYHFVDLSLTLFGIIYVVFQFSFLALSRNLPNGIWILWFIIIGAFVTDTTAYFVGVSIGKKKILPLVSPKKSLEGMIGGIVGCIIFTTIYGLYINKIGILEGVTVYHYLLLGAVNGIISQVGDWTASAIKRYVNVKDYGYIMPGHGGVLDRFDSILIIAPVVYFFFTIII